MDRSGMMVVEIEEMIEAFMFYAKPA